MAGTKKRYKPETVRAAFSRFFVDEESAEGEQRMFCPVCEDPSTSKSPSAMMNAESGVWNCLKGAHGGSIYHLVQDLKRERGFDIRSEAMKGRHADKEYSQAAKERLSSGRSRIGADLPSQDQIESWTSNLLSNPTRLQAMKDQRGILENTIIESEMGWDGQRYTIPVRDADGELVNVRRYKMGAGASANKMLNLAGHGQAAIYRPDILAAEEQVVITEGEMDCILLNQLGIKAVTHTAGASTFRPQWGQYFTDKVVWICYDADDAGRKGAAKVRQIIQSYASAVYTIQLPEITKGFDVTDYFHLEGHSTDEFRELMVKSMDDMSGVRTSKLPIKTEGEHMSLGESMSEDSQKKTIELIVSVAGKQQEPYTAPKSFDAVCDQSKGAACERCPLMARGGAANFEIRADDENLFRFVDVADIRRKQLLKEISGVRCSDRVEFEEEESWHVEELLVQPSVDDRQDDETQQPVKRTVFSVSTHDTAVNQKRRLVGKNVHDPKTGKLRFMPWINESVDMDIDKFKLDDEMRERLSIFRPREDQSPLDKCIEIAEDMAKNVTHIYGRTNLHVAYDLLFHSPLAFKVGDHEVDRGWLEIAVVGDTRTGKTEAASKLMNHYRSGILQSCEGMSFPGLVGGVQQIDGRWHMTWGVIPMNDRRAVFLDEVSGLADKDVIEQMSSIRSSGIAQVTKIVSEQTSARTRLAWIMNPKDGSAVKDSPQGAIGALRTVVPNPEDIARFDLVIAAAKDDVDAKVINKGFTDKHSPSYSSEECESLVKWSWSLTRSDVFISARSAKAATKAALDLGGRYVSDPPLIQVENVRFKVLRIAAAIAARTFSVDDNGRLLVMDDHVEDAVRFMDMVYGEQANGYLRNSRKTIMSQKQSEEKRSKVRTYLEEHEDDVFLTLRMVGGSVFRNRDLVEFGGLDTDAARAVVNTLLKWQVVRLKSRGEIQMTSVLIEVVKEMEEKDFANAD